MKSCSSAYCVLIVVMVTAVEVSESVVTVTLRVKVGDRAILPCSQSCSGEVAKWTPSSNPSDTLAECDQTSCRSVKEGYQMIHDQYLKGDLSLIITKADLSKRGRYTCECGKSEINDVELQVIADIVKVKINDPATLPCNEACSGKVARWTVSSNPRDTLAECDQTSCRSVKEGYQMIHDRYLNGDLSLIVTKADVSKRGVYTCYCDETGIRDVYLWVADLISYITLISGDSLELKLDVSDPVEVIYNREGGSSRVQICRVDGGSVQCKAEYTQRVSLTSSVLTLRGMKPSDSGDYIIRETSTKREIQTYSVTVRDPLPQSTTTIGLSVAVGVLGVLVLVLVGVVWCCRHCRRTS